MSRYQGFLKSCGLLFSVLLYDGVSAFPYRPSMLMSCMPCVVWCTNYSKCLSGMCSLLVMQHLCLVDAVPSVLRMMSLAMLTHSWMCHSMIRLFPLLSRMPLCWLMVRYCSLPCHSVNPSACHCFLSVCLSILTRKNYQTHKHTKAEKAQFDIFNISAQAFIRMSVCLSVCTPTWAHLVAFLSP